MEEKKFEKDLLTESVIGCCFQVHNELDPGFLEKVYHNALIHSLKMKELNFETEKNFDVFFINQKVGIFRCDLLIEKKLILEIKSVTGFMPVLFRNQVLSYLKASGIKTGLLVNFGNKSCEIKRLSM